MLYGLYLLSLARAWKNFRLPSYSESSNTIGVSIVIAARNEANTLPSLLEDLNQQNHPFSHLEVIVIDDASEDGTLACIENYQSKVKYSLKAIRLEDSKGFNIYKKRAIEKGIEIAGFPIIVTTDADCRVGKNWLSQLVLPFSNPNIQLVLGPVQFHYQPGFFQAFQQLEFSSLIGVTAATSHLGHPLMCNGANLAYRKDCFYAVGGYGNDGFASGDDMFLLHKIQNRFPGQILFMQTKESMVSTQSKQDFSEFLGQRKRWVSKNRFLPDWKTLTVGALTYASSVSIVIYFLLVLGGESWMIFPLLSAMIIKGLTDYFFLKTIANFFNLDKSLPYFFPAYLMNLIYTSLILPYSSLGRNYQWKGRSVR